MSIPTEKEILTALAQDPFFGNTRAYPWVRDAVKLLPGTIGEQRMDQKITPRDLLSVEVGFLRVICKMPDLAPGLRKRFSKYAEGCAQIVEDFEAWLSQENTDADSFMLGEQIGLNPEMKALYTKGDLTYGDLLRSQPGVYLPRD
jgi:hypothetical protein